MRARGVGYWALAIALTVVGFVDLVAIGAPFFLTGLALIAVGPSRHRPEVLWPALASVWTLVVGYVLFGPLGCTTSGGAPAEAAGPALERTTCTNVLGIDYSGGVGYSPSLMPALLAGVALAVVAAIVVRRLVRRPGHAEVG
jgi:hypothetical protein